MANLPEDTLAIVLELQKQLLYLLDRASATEYSLIERYGETSETIPELDELQNVKERAMTYYTRFHRVLSQIALVQPRDSSDTLKLLARSIEETLAIVSAGEASVKEIQRNWELL